MYDTFSSLLGVKQGCPLSPTLFGIFIDDFQCELEAGAVGFGLPTLAGALIPALFYADDLALISESESLHTEQSSPTMAQARGRTCAQNGI